uniref:Uncharacterized protein n=1 Tax=Physcomitrium patens TaxID=3218 RepID=A0A2K1IGN1_PHYPA|nr:hypothetical protein PHYPA_029029 [Physcomitrium patens]
MSGVRSIWSRRPWRETTNVRMILTNLVSKLECRDSRHSCNLCAGSCECLKYYVVIVEWAIRASLWSSESDFLNKSFIAYYLRHIKK